MSSRAEEVIERVTWMEARIADLERQLNPERPAYWMVVGHRVEERTLACPGVRIEHVRLCLETLDWEAVPGLVHKVLEWQLESGVCGDDWTPDPTPITISYVPDNGEPGTGAF